MLSKGVQLFLLIFVIQEVRRRVVISKVLAPSVVTIVGILWSEILLSEAQLRRHPTTQQA